MKKFRERWRGTGRACAQSDTWLVSLLFVFVAQAICLPRPALAYAHKSRSTPSPTLTPKPTATPTLTPTPKPTATPTPCITITSPANGSVVSGSVAIKTNDTCTNNWFESLYVDGAWVGDFVTGQVVFNSVSYSAGNHLLEVTSQSANPGSAMLGSTSINLTVQTATPTPVTTSSPTPTPAPSPTPITSSCISITAPAANATVAGSNVSIGTSDSCAGAWYESLYVDGTHVSDYSPGAVVLDSTAFINGAHTVEVTSQSANPGSVQLGSASEPLNLQNGTTPTPTPTPTPVPASSGHYSTLRPGSSLPSESSCISQVDASPEPENAPWNQNDGTGYNSNRAAAVASYFYQNAGIYPGNYLPNSDFQSVTGSYTGTTDDIFRVYACKWGIDEDLVRSQAWSESGWHQDCAAAHGGSGCNEGGDYNNPSGNPSGLPITSITPGGVFSAFDGFGGVSSPNHYDSWSIVQNKVYYMWMTWPMMEQSTSFGIDYRYAEMRGCMNGDQYSYFHSQSAASGTDYQNAVAQAKNNPNGLASGTMGPLIISNETWLQYVTTGCVETHFTGDWWIASDTSYVKTIWANATSTSPPWPGKLK